MTVFKLSFSLHLFQVNQKPDVTIQTSKPVVDPTHRKDGESQHQTYSNPNASQSFSQQSSSAIAHSYPETGAFIANPSSLPSSYGNWPTTSLLNQGSRPFPSSVTSSDYLTSFSVALAQTQLSQYQNSSSQQQMQQFQQQLLLQQQQLILQQQEMLKQQQSQHHTHDSDQVQIGLLLQQILQQQKQLTDLELKIKDKNEHQVKLENKEPSAPNNTEDEKKPTSGSEHQIIEKKESSPSQAGKVECAKDDSKISLSSLVPSEDHKNAGVSKTDSITSSSTFVPDYASVGKWFSDLSITPIVDKPNTDTKDNDGETAKDLGSEHSSNNEHHVESVVEDKEEVEHETLKEENRDNTQNVEISDLKPESEQFEPEPVKSDQANDDDDYDSDDDELYLKDDDIALIEEDNKPPKVEKDEDEEMEEARKRKLEEQIKQIKELQNKPPVHTTSTFYEPGQVPTSRPNEPLSGPTDEEENKPSLLRQCGHYYASQISSIDQATNNSCLNSDEALQALVSAVKGFDLVVKSLSADKNGSGLDGFSIEWRVSYPVVKQVMMLHFFNE